MCGGKSHERMIYDDQIVVIDVLLDGRFAKLTQSSSVPMDVYSRVMLFVFAGSPDQRRVPAWVVPGKSLESDCHKNSFARCARRSSSLSSQRLRGLGPLGREKNVLAVHDDLVSLIQHLTSFHHAAVCRTFRILLFFLNRDPGAQRIPNEHGLGKAQLVVTVGERNRIDLAGCESDADGESHGAVGNSLAKLGLACKLGINVMREKISRVSGMDDDIGLGDGAPRGHTPSSHSIVLEIFRHSRAITLRKGALCHRLPLINYNSPLAEPLLSGVDPYDLPRVPGRELLWQRSLLH